MTLQTRHSIVASASLRMGILVVGAASQSPTKNLSLPVLPSRPANASAILRSCSPSRLIEKRPVSSIVLQVPVARLTHARTVGGDADTEQTAVAVTPRRSPFAVTVATMQTPPASRERALRKALALIGISSSLVHPERHRKRALSGGRNELPLGRRTDPRPDPGLDASRTGEAVPLRF